MLLMACAQTPYSFDPANITYNAKAIDYNIIKYRIKMPEKVTMPSSASGSLPGKWEYSLKNAFFDNSIFNYQSTNLAVLEISILDIDWGPFQMAYEANIKSKYSMKDLASNIIVFEKVIESHGENNSLMGIERRRESLRNSIQNNIILVIKELEAWSNRNSSSSIASQ